MCLVYGTVFCSFKDFIVVVQCRNQNPKGKLDKVETWKSDNCYLKHANLHEGGPSGYLEGR